MHERQVTDWVQARVPRAVLARDGDGSVVAHLGDPNAEHAALRRSVALVVASPEAQILAEGRDAVDYLHRRLSQAIAPLAVGSGTHALLLDGDGRMLADLSVWRGQDAVMLLTPRPLAETTFARLDQYILMDQVELTRFWLNEPLVALVGPRAPALLAGLMDTCVDYERLARDPWSAWFTINLAGLPCRIFGEGRHDVPFYHLSAPPMALGRLLDALADACRETGGGLAGALALDLLRIESGVPRFGKDLSERTIPLEAGLHDAISFTKGCYPGQEVIAHLADAGHPARVLARLTLAGEHDLPPGAKLIVDGEPAGHITSSVTWPGLGRTEALGYLKWEHRRAAEARVVVAAGELTTRVTPLRRLEFYGKRAAVASADAILT